MAQYRVGTVNLTAGSATVVGVGTSWIGQVFANNLFVHDGVVYTVAADATDNEELSLTAPYAGTTVSGASYVVHRDFNNLGLPLMQDGDLETVALYNQLVAYMGTNGGFMQGGNNGSEFTDPAAVRTNIGVYSQAQVDALLQAQAAQLEQDHIALIIGLSK